MNRLLILVLCSSVLSCNGISGLRNSLKDLPPYEQYLKNLEMANLTSRPMVKRWVAAGEEALRDSVIVTLPFRETGSFISHRPEARSYQFDGMDGQIITVDGAMKVTQGARFFADLFIQKDNEWRHVASSDSSLTLTHELTQNSKCLLRIQPELLVNAYYTVSIGVTPVLINPVYGATNRSIQSYYGATRDGGRRSHEGVDIFAKKGTAVVAPTKGTISRVGYSKLGGKVVWMYDVKRGHSYYFAHLDSQYVKPGMLLKQGDTLGTVGNTGNARYTPSHLHFGIYQSKSKDPLFYIKTLEAMEPNAAVDTTFQFLPFKIGRKKSTLRSGPSISFIAVRKLPEETFLYVIGQSREWYRVALPDNRQGFVLKTELVTVKNGPIAKLSSEKEMYADPIEQNLIQLLSENEKVERLAKFANYTLVRTKQGVEGWID